MLTISYLIAAFLSGAMFGGSAVAWLATSESRPRRRYRAPLWRRVWWRLRDGIPKP